MRPYLPNNDTDFSGMVRLVESNGINANNLMTSHLGAGKHCRFPGAAPTTPEEQKLEAAKRNLSRICLLVLSVSTGAEPACVGGECCCTSCKCSLCSSTRVHCSKPCLLLLVQVH
jgi:hypothetical protein